MRLSLNYFGVLFVVASIWRFVFFFYDNVELRRMAQNVYRQSPDGDTESGGVCLQAARNRHVDLY